MNQVHASPSGAGRGLLLLVVLAAPLLFSTANVEVFEFPKLLLLVSGAILLGAVALARWEWSLQALRQPLPLMVVLFLLSAVVSTAFSIQPLTSLLGAFESHGGLVTLATCAVVFFATRAWCRSWHDGRCILSAAVAAGGVAAIYAILQWLQLDPIAWPDRLKFGVYLRPFGTLGHPNYLAAYLVLVVPIALGLAEMARRERHWLAFGAFACCAGLGGFAIVLSISRGGWLGLAAAGLVLGLGKWRGMPTRKSWGLTALVTLFLVLSGVAVSLQSGVVAQTLRDRIMHLADGSGRLHLWKASLDIWWDHPVLGCGVDAFQVAFPKHRSLAYDQVEWNATPARAHNEALHILATQGLIGALALVGLLAASSWAGMHAYRRAPEAHRPLVLAVLAGLVGYGVQDFFSFTVLSCAPLLAVMGGLLARWSDAPQEATDTGWFRPWLAVSGLTCGGLLTWEYVQPVDPSAAGPAAALAFVVGSLAFFVVVLVRRAGSVSDRSLPCANTTPAADAPGSPSRILLWRGLVACLTLLLLAVLVSRPLQADLACRAGDRLLGDAPVQAVACYEKAVKRQPLNAHYWMMLGGGAQTAAPEAATTTERIARLERALAAFERACALAPQEACGHLNRGLVLARLTREGQANAECVFAALDEALALDPQNAVFQAKVGNAALALGDYQRARRHAEQGRALKPAYGPPQAQLAYLALAKGDYLGGCLILEEAVKADWGEEKESLGFAFGALARAYNHTGYFEGAIIAGRQAVKLAPRWVEAQRILALALEKARQ